LTLTSVQSGIPIKVVIILVLLCTYACHCIQTKDWLFFDPFYVMLRPS